jgi:UDP:flavonoid glycosyltransferase YjiC (YdhE family)
VGRYLIAASPIPGHVMPLLLVGRDLRSRGHDVVMLTGDEHRQSVEEAGLQATGLAEDARPKRARQANPVTPALVRRWLNGRAEMTSVFIAPLVAQFNALRALLEQQAFDAVLCDLAFTGVLPLLLGDGSRVPVLVCGVGPLTLSSADTPPFGLGWRPRQGRDYRAMTWTVHNILMADIQSALNKTLAGVGVGPCPVFLTDWPVLAERLLQFTVAAMEFPRRDLPGSVDFTGPVVGDVPKPREGARGRTVVHVTQGTWDNDDLDELVMPTLVGLADRDDILVVATTGNKKKSVAPQDIPTNARVTDFIPYAELLPTVDVMVTNGGYGGVHHALLYGIPLVIGGATADKPEIAARVAHAGAGVDLGAARPTPAAVAAAVQHVLRTPRYRHAARRLGEELRRHNAFERIAETIDDVVMAAR